MPFSTNGLRTGKNLPVKRHWLGWPESISAATPPPRSPISPGGRDSSIAEELTTEHFGDREFFVFRNAAAAAPCDTTHLLPAYDQYLIGYKDRSDVLAKEHTSKAFNSHGIFQQVILCDGQIVGNWKRTAGRGNVTIQTTLWVNAVPKALDAAVARYRSFIGGTKSENSPEAL